MSDKLPDEVEEALREARRAHCGCLNDEISDIEASIAKAIRDAEERMRDACVGLLTRLNRDHNAKDPEEAYAIGRFTRAIDAIRSLPLENA